MRTPWGDLDDLNLSDTKLGGSHPLCPDGQCKFPFSDRDTDDLIFGLNNGEVTNFSLLADCGIRTLFSIMVKPKWSKTIGSLYMMTDHPTIRPSDLAAKMVEEMRGITSPRVRDEELKSLRMPF
ncbi:MAG: hypothetical protein ACKO0Z_19085 [Betaproteobacteria bacterium]